jgi:hypothetical protein
MLNHSGRYVDRGQLFLRNPNFQLIGQVSGRHGHRVKAAAEGEPDHPRVVTLPIAHGMMLAIIGIGSEAVIAQDDGTRTSMRCGADAGTMMRCCTPST